MALIGKTEGLTAMLSEAALAALLQVMVKTLWFTNELTISVPKAALVPDQSPVAVQAVALFEAQDNATGLPLATESALSDPLASMITCGAEALETHAPWLLQDWPDAQALQLIVPPQPLFQLPQE